MSQANVSSIDALRDFRAAISIFGEDATGALGAVDMEIRRTVHWVTHEQRMYWQSEVKKRKERLSMAQSELHRRKLGNAMGHTASYSEQMEIFKKAKAHLEDAERRALALKKWEPVLQQAVLEYHSRTQRLRDAIGGEMPKAQALLERIIDSLDAYTRVAPPSGQSALGGASASASAAPEGSGGGESVARPVDPAPVEAAAEAEPEPTENDGEPRETNPETT